MSDDAYTVTRAQRIGDLLMVAVKLPFYTPTLALILAGLIVVFAVARWQSPVTTELMAQVFLWSLLPAAPAALAAACLGRYWRVVLDGRGLRASGPCRRRGLAYDDLRLLRLDGALQPAGDEPPNADLLLRIQPHAGHELRIDLPAAAAQALFDTLRARSPHAAALGADGTAYPARVDDDGEAGRRMRRAILRRGGALATGGAAFLLLAVFAGGPPGESASAVHDAMLRSLLIGHGLVFLAFGMRLLGHRAARGRPSAETRRPIRAKRK